MASVIRSICRLQANFRRSTPLPDETQWARQLQVAMRFVAEVIAVRDVPAGGSVGYGARWTAERPSRIATLAAGSTSAGTRCLRPRPFHDIGDPP